MNRFIKRALVFAVMTALTLLICIAVACGKDNDTLSAPKDLYISDEVLNWSAVDGASRYVVEIDGIEYDADTNSLDIFLLTDAVKTYSISVIAINDKNSAVSDWSDTLKYTVAQPQNLTYVEINDGTAFAVGVTTKTKIISAVK